MRRCCATPRPGAARCARARRGIWSTASATSTTLLFLILVVICVVVLGLVVLFFLALIFLLIVRLGICVAAAKVRLTSRAAWRAMLSGCTYIDANAADAADATAGTAAAACLRRTLGKRRLATECALIERRQLFTW